MNRLPDHETSPGFFVDPAFADALSEMGLTTLDSVFAFDAASAVGPLTIAAHRSRVCFRLGTDGPMVYLKRYHRTPKIRQLINWFEQRCRCCTSVYDGHRTEELDAVGVAVPKTIAYGYEWDGLFEKRSFILIHEISDAHSLEELPAFMRDFSPAAAGRRKAFVRQVADFVRRFHDTGCRHRDLYLCHLFLDRSDKLAMIDLHRIFKPLLLGERFRRKDLAQLYYSSPKSGVTRTDRLRFYLAYRRQKKLSLRDKRMIGQIKQRAQRIAVRDRRKGRVVPFESL
jgi:heptose I phosphotransferase